MIIRKASANDTNYIAPLLLLAMQDIVYQFIDSKDNDKAREFLAYFIEKENNQYSYQNCFVAVEENIIVAAVNLYNGAKLHELRLPVLEYISRHNRSKIHIEDETQTGEYYIDSLGVNENFQGKGIGTKMLQFLIVQYVNKKKQTLGLLVDKDNLKAKKLYLKLGFEHVDEKFFMGKIYEHLQVKPS